MPCSRGHVKTGDMKMCIANVYVDGGDERKEVMRDVVWIEAEGNRFRLVNLLGEEKYIEGAIKTIFLWPDLIRCCTAKDESPALSEST